MLVDRIDLESGEKLVATSRRHKFTLILELIGLSLVSLIPIVLLFVALAYQELLPFVVLDYFSFFTYFYAFWLLMIWTIVFTVLSEYYLDVLIVTNKRLIIANQKGFWRRSLSSFRLERLQDVNVEINGILATLLDFGTLRAETAGHGAENFHMDNLPNPRALKDKIMNALDSDKRD